MSTIPSPTSPRWTSAIASAMPFLLTATAFFFPASLLRAQPCPGGGGVAGSPITCDVEYKTSLGYGKKCSDFQEFYQSQWPRWQMYLDKTTRGVYRSTSTNEGYGVIGDWAGEYQILSAEFYYTHTTNLDDITLVQRYDRTDCNYTNIYSGFYSALSLDVDNRDMVAPGGSGGCYPLYIYYWRELISDNAAPTLCSSGGASNWKRVGTFSQEEDSTETNNCYSGVFQYSTNFVYTNDVSVPGDGIGLNIDASTPTYRASSSSDGTITRTEELTNLFSDADLRGLILGQMPAYPGTWYLPDPYFDIIWNRCAYSYKDACGHT